MALHMQDPACIMQGTACVPLHIQGRACKGQPCRISLALACCKLQVHAPGNITRLSQIKFSPLPPPSTHGLC